MAIQSSELKYYKPTLINDTGTNGGRMSATEITTAQKNNIFPDISQSERTAGTTRYRKIYFKVASAEDLALIDPRLFIETQSPGDDRVLMFAGSQTDTQADIGAPDLYGCGQLESDVSTGATSVVVVTEAGSDLIFRDGALIRISNKVNVDDATGSTDWIRLAASSAVSWNGDQATLTFEAGQALENDYTAASTRVSSVIEAADINTSLTGWTETSSSGTYDEVTNPVVMDHIGTIEETWTLTFTDATNFSVVGAIVGSVGGGSIGGGDFAPNNTDFTAPYFTLPDAGWAGTWANGDTITFTTHPAAFPAWFMQVVPAGADSVSANGFSSALSGESA